MRIKKKYQWVNSIRITKR